MMENISFIFIFHFHFHLKDAIGYGVSLSWIKTADTVNNLPLFVKTLKYIRT